MFRFGVLGTSHFAITRMIPAIQAGHATAVVAIASRDGGRAAEVARGLGVGKPCRIAQDEIKAGKVKWLIPEVPKLPVVAASEALSKVFPEDA